MRLWAPHRLRNFIGALLLLLSLSSCLVKRVPFNVGDAARRHENPPPNDSGNEIQRSMSIDFTNANRFNFNPALISWSGTSFLLKMIPGAFFYDDFDDANTSDWSHISFQGSSLLSATQTSNVFYVESSGTLLALANTAMPELSAGVVEASMTPTGFNGLALVGLIARQSGSRYYFGTTYGGSHRIMYFNGESPVLIASVPASFTPQVGTTYNLKLKTEGTQLDYKIWVDGEAEPSWMISASNTFLNSGRSGFIVSGGTQEIESFVTENLLEESSDPYYSTASPALLLPNFDLSDESELNKFSRLEVETEVPHGASLGYEVSINSGISWIVPNQEGVWVFSDQGAATSVSLEKLNAHLETLPTDSKRLRLRVYLNTEDRFVTPEILSAELSYTTHSE
jgi:hypothetical protein